MLFPIKLYNTVFENNFTVCFVRTPAWMDSATKKAHILLPLPFSFAFPLPLFSSHTLRFFATLGRELFKDYSTIGVHYRDLQARVRVHEQETRNLTLHEAQPSAG